MTPYIIFLTIYAVVFLMGYILGTGRERNRQARIREQSIRLRHFAPSNVSKN